MKPFVKFCCAAIATATALALSITAAAHADAVVVDTFTVSFVDDFNCSFPVNVTITGEIRRQVHGDRTHNVYKQQYTWTNPSNGKQLFSISNGPDRILNHPDGSATIYATGIFAAVNVSGQGNVLHVAGRFVLFVPANPNEPVQLISKSGPNQPISNICPYLAN